MGVRIFLVSMVAGLGLTLPSVDQVDQWRTNARGWVNERLAEWDARMPVDVDAFVIVPQPPVVETAAPAIRKSETTEIKTAQEIAPAVAPLEAQVAGLDAPTRPMDLDEAATTPAPAFAPVSSPLMSDEGFLAAQDEFVAGYAIEIAAAKTLREADEPENLFPGLAYEWNLAPESLDPLPWNVGATTSQSPRIESVEVAENLDEGLAYELNRNAEGLEPMLIEFPRLAEKATLTDREGRLTTAVRLTREAVHAWANLFHGPAVVTIAQ